MNTKTNHKTTNSHDADQLMEELLSAWDSHSRRIDKALTVAPPHVDFSHLEAQRRRHAARFLTTAAALAALAVATAFVFHPLADDRNFRLIAIILVAIDALSALYCLWRALSRPSAAAIIPTFSTSQISAVGLTSLLLTLATHLLPAGDGYQITLASNLLSRTDVILGINQVFCIQ